MAEDAQPKGPRKVSVWVKVFALFQLFCFVSWSLPSPPEAIANGTYDCNKPLNFIAQPLNCFYLVNDRIERKSPHRYYIMSSGVWQYWDMFAPNPSPLDIYLDAEVTYQDGSKKIVPYPRMYDLSLGQKYMKERFRKYVERVNEDKYSWKWPTLGHYMAQVAYEDPKNPPVIVVMRRHWRFVTPQDKDKPQQENYNDYNFYTHLVVLDDLKRDKPL